MASTPEKRTHCSVSKRSSHRTSALISPSKPQLITSFEADFSFDINAMSQMYRVPGKGVLKSDARIDRAITRVLALETSQWVEGAQTLYNYVQENRKGMGKLKSKLIVAVDVKVKDAERIADILKRGPCLDPDEQDKVFMLFKTRRYARLFAKKPEMLEHVKTKAQADTYNKGWRAKVNFYEKIAEDATEILDRAEILCKIDEERGALIEGMNMSLRETIDAMDWYADNKHAEISTIYEEYKDVPSGDMFEEVESKPIHHPMKEIR